jgi:nucleotide-binding universal stress UspA family protein
MKTIIVPIDFSDAANNATAYAANLAHSIQAKIILYNAFYLSIPPSEAPVLTPRLDQIFSEDKALLEAKGKEIASKYNISVECFSSPMSIVDQLPALVKKYHADLVIMGMRGTNSFNRRLFGSTTVSILRIAKFPVLVIPEEASFQQIKTILFAFEPDGLSKRNELKLLKEFADLFKAKVKILHVALPDEQKEKIYSKEDLEKFDTLLYKVKHDYIQIEDDHIFSGINKGITDTNANLLVMIPGEHNVWETLTNRSNTRKVALHAHIPLLTLPNL